MTSLCGGHLFFIFINYVLRYFITFSQITSDNNTGNITQTVENNVRNKVAMREMCLKNICLIAKF